MTNIHKKNITKNFISIGTNPKWNKNLFKNGYLTPLFEPLKSVWGGRHIAGYLMLIKCYENHIGATSSTNSKLTHIASNGTPSVEDLPPLARFKGRAFRISNSCPSSEVIKIWSSSSNSSSLASSLIAWSSSTPLTVRVFQLGQFAWNCP